MKRLTCRYCPPDKQVRQNFSAPRYLNQHEKSCSYKNSKVQPQYGFEYASSSQNQYATNPPIQTHISIVEEKRELETDNDKEEYEPEDEYESYMDIDIEYNTTIMDIDEPPSLKAREPNETDETSGQSSEISYGKAYNYERNR